MTTNWTARAACQGMDGDLWFPVSYDSPADAVRIDAAISICHRCPVRVECLDEALTNEAGRKLYSRHGIRGGHTPQDRYNHYRRSARAHATAGAA